MKMSQFTEKQIAYALGQAQAGSPVGDVCREVGVSQARIYVCKNKYAPLAVTEIRNMHMLAEENA